MHYCAYLAYLNCILDYLQRRCVEHVVYKQAICWTRSVYSVACSFAWIPSTILAEASLYNEY